MKTVNFFFFFSFFFFSTLATAQRGTVEGHIGLGWSSLRPSAPFEAAGARFGLSAGGVINLPLRGSEWIAFRTGLIYASTGGKIATDSVGEWLRSFPGQDWVGSATLKLAQLQVPLGFQARWHPIPLGGGATALRPWATVEPLVIGLRAKARIDLADYPVVNASIRKDVSFVTLGFALGAGCDYRLGESLAGYLGFGWGGCYTHLVRKPIGATQSRFVILLGIRFGGV